MTEPTNQTNEEQGEYAGGEIKDRPGRIAWWLVIVYFILGVWALYYLITQWGGMGPGLDF